MILTIKLHENFSMILGIVPTSSCSDNNINANRNKTQSSSNISLTNNHTLYCNFMVYTNSSYFKLKGQFV